MGERMNVTLLVCEKPNTKPEYSIDFEMPALPREGDYISVVRIDPATGKPRFSKLLSDRNKPDASEHMEYEAFVVKRVRWDLKFPCNGTGYGKAGDKPGTVSDVAVEVVPARSYFMHPRFKDSLPKSAPEFEWG